MSKYVYAVALLAHFVYAQDGTQNALNGTADVTEAASPINGTESPEEYPIAYPMGGSDEAAPPIVSNAEVTSPIGSEIVGNNFTTVTEGMNGTEWHTDDLYERCTGHCNITCTRPCPVWKKCGSEERQCGNSPIDTTLYFVDCDGEPKCIPKHCECATGECPIYCPETCLVDQTKCVWGYDDNGCKIQETCIHCGYGIDNKLCPCHCDNECDDDKIKCCPPDVNGCKQLCECLPKLTDNVGLLCEVQQCPCDDKNCDGLCCEGKYDETTGCKESDACVSPPSTECAAHCPVVCGNDLQCPDWCPNENGCPSPGTCVECAKDKNGKCCPPTSASNVAQGCCQKVCGPDEDICDPPTEDNGCLSEPVCKPCKRDKNGNCCNKETHCWPDCPPLEHPCQDEGLDDDGCPHSPYCIETPCGPYEKCDELCDGICRYPEQTGPCANGLDDKGCPKPSFCEPNQKKSWGDGCPDEWCPGWCPPICIHGEHLCESYPDPCNGCPVEPVCRPIPKSTEGQNCPQNPLSASYGCGISCNSVDGAEVLCPPLEDTSYPGCKAELQCKARTEYGQGPGGEKLYCPGHSVCPKQCNAGEKLCDTGSDKNGCKNQEACILIPNDQNSGQECADFRCPQVCADNQKYCAGLYKENDLGQICPERDYCVNYPVNKYGDYCPGHCRQECPEGQESVQPEGLDPSSECPWAYQCQAVASSAPTTNPATTTEAWTCVDGYDCMIENGENITQTQKADCEAYYHEKDGYEQTIETCQTWAAANCSAQKVIFDREMESCHGYTGNRCENTKYFSNLNIILCTKTAPNTDEFPQSIKDTTEETCGGEFRKEHHDGVDHEFLDYDNWDFCSNGSGSQIGDKDNCLAQPGCCWNEEKHENLGQCFKKGKGDLMN